MIFGVCIDIVRLDGFTPVYKVLLVSKVERRELIEEAKVVQHPIVGTREVEVIWSKR